MSESSRDIAVADLELSIRTSDLLRSEGIASLGELLDRAVFRATRGSIRELNEVFAELGLEYSGRMEASDSLSDVPRTATGSIEQQWATIKTWLEGNHPKQLQMFRPPASSEQITAVETKLGHKLPDDYKAFLHIHNGQQSSAPMICGASLLPVEKLADQRLFGELDMEIPAEFVGEGVRPVDLSAGWLPIANEGRQYLCMDLDPASGGSRGQVIGYRGDEAERPLIAKSFGDFLAQYFEQIQSGEIDLEDE